ncbi:hypothetical protein BDW62DRAFT_98292 [Aspergillus aurantiobrunneus]
MSTLTPFPIQSSNLGQRTSTLGIQGPGRTQHRKWNARRVYHPKREGWGGGAALKRRVEQRQCLVRGRPPITTEAIAEDPLHGIGVSVSLLGMSQAGTHLLRLTCYAAWFETVSAASSCVDGEIPSVHLVLLYIPTRRGIGPGGTRVMEGKNMEWYDGCRSNALTC